MYIFLALIAIPTVLGMFAWALTVVYRLCFPARRPAYRVTPVLVRRWAEVGEEVPVGVREIRENQRRVLAEQDYVRYSYTGGISRGLPAAWVEDLQHRRN